MPREDNEWQQWWNHNENDSDDDCKDDDDGGDGDDDDDDGSEGDDDTLWRPRAANFFPCLLLCWDLRTQDSCNCSWHQCSAGETAPSSRCIWKPWNMSAVDPTSPSTPLNALKSER